MAKQVFKAVLYRFYSDKIGFARAEDGTDGNTYVVELNKVVTGGGRQVRPFLGWRMNIETAEDGLTVTSARLIEHT